MITFVLKLKEFRKLRNLTQKQLAEKAGITQEYISYLEKGELRFKSPTLNTIQKLSIALDCCPYCLIVPNCDLVYGTCKVDIKIPMHKDIGQWVKELEKISKKHNISIEKLAKKAVELVKKEYPD